MWTRNVILIAVTLSSIAARYTDTGPDDPVTIPCPSCSGERCSGVRVCHFGTFRNELCGDRLDCYKAPGEVCGETVRRVLGRCRPGLQCRCGVCVGHLLDKSFELTVPCWEFLAGRK